MQRGGGYKYSGDSQGISVQIWKVLKNDDGDSSHKFYK